MLISKQTVSYEEIKDDLKTGDIILMHGLQSGSRVIETVEGSPWSHAVMIVLAEDVGFLKCSCLAKEIEIDVNVKQL